MNRRGLSLSLCWRDVVEKRKEVVRAEQERKEWLENESNQNTKRDFLKMCLVTRLCISAYSKGTWKHTQQPCYGYKVNVPGD